MIEVLVYEFLTAIPKGKVVTYGQIAEFLGNRKLARVVGNILHKNPDGEIFPCFKVVDKKGHLSKNYAFGGLKIQKEKLEKEGIIVEQNRVKNGFMIKIYILKCINFSYNFIFIHF